MQAGLPHDRRHGLIQLAMGWQGAHLDHVMVGTRHEGLRYSGDPQLLDIDLWQLGDGRFCEHLDRESVNAELLDSSVCRP